MAGYLKVCEALPAVAGEGFCRKLSVRLENDACRDDFPPPGIRYPKDRHFAHRRVTEYHGFDFTGVDVFHRR